MHFTFGRHRGHRAALWHLALAPFVKHRHLGPGAQGSHQLGQLPDGPGGGRVRASHVYCQHKEGLMVEWVSCLTARYDLIHLKSIERWQAKLLNNISVPKFRNQLRNLGFYRK